MKFRTSTSHYVYDVNLNLILKVDGVQFDIVDDFGVLGLDDIVLRHKHEHPPRAIGNAYRKLASARDTHGYFSNNRPKSIAYMLDEPSLRKLYEESINVLTLGVTEQCNLRCSYCIFSGTNPNNRQHNALQMGSATLEKALVLFEQHSRLSRRLSIAFYGGEPLLNFDLIMHCVSRAKQMFRAKPIAYQMTTNATLLSDAVCAFLADNNFDLQVSLDGPQALHDRYRRTGSGDPTFATVASRLARFQQRAPEYYADKIAFNMVLAPPFDYEALDAFAKQAPIIANNRIRTNFVVDLDTTFYNRFTPEILSGASVFEEKKKAWWTAMGLSPGTAAAGATGDKLKHELYLQQLGVFAASLGRHEPFGETVYPGGACVPGLRKLYVSADGRLFPCEKAMTTSDLLCLGDVESGLDVARAMQMVREFSSLHDRCRYCQALRHCTVCFLYCDSDGKLDCHRKGRMCDRCVAGLKNSLHDVMELLEINPKALDFAKDIRIR